MKYITTTNLATIMRLDAAALKLHGADIYVDTSPACVVDHAALAPKRYAAPMRHPTRVDYAYPVDVTAEAAYAVLVLQGVALPPLLLALPREWIDALAAVTGH